MTFIRMKKIFLLALFLIGLKICSCICYAQPYAINEIFQANPNHKISIEKMLSHLEGSKQKLLFDSLKGGMTSSGVYKFFLGNKEYILKILNPKYPYEQRKNEIEGQRIASASGLAPSVIYADPDALLFVSQFVKGKPIAQKELANPQIREKLAKHLKKLHDYSGKHEYKRVLLTNY